MAINHEKASVNSSRIPAIISQSIRLALLLKPMTRPVTIITKVEKVFLNTSEMTWPCRTAEVAIGNDRKRSTMPF